jgi:hypothetical protein
MIKIEYKIDETIDDKIDDKIKHKIYDKLKHKIVKKIQPVFICNGKCSYCITNKCYDI